MVQNSPAIDAIEGVVVEGETLGICDSEIGCEVFVGELTLGMLDCARRKVDPMKCLLD